jgi:hypothetical protein
LLAGFPFNDEMIASTLQRMLSPQTTGRELDSNVLNDLHRSTQSLPNTHPMRSLFLACVGDFYMEFRQYQSEDALDKAVYIYEDAMPPRNDTLTPVYAGKYGIALLHRFEQKGIVDDINKSISALEDAVSLTPDGRPDKPCSLNNLGSSLLGRFERLGDLNDLNTSVSVKEDAVRLTPDGHPAKPLSLNNLGNSLLRRFEHLGDLNDLNTSISVFEDAVQLTPDGHPDKPSWLNNLGNSLLGHFERLGDLSDLNTSISVFEDAVQLTPDGHPDKPLRLNNLGLSLFRRFERLRDLSNLNTSDSVKENAVQLTPDGHPNKPSWLNNLGNSLLGHFERLGDLSDLNTSISVFEDAVQLTPDGHPNKPSRLNNLGISLLGRFERLGDLSDLNMSVSVKENAVQLTPDGHPDKPSLLYNLGKSLLHRFDRLRDLSDIKMAGTVFEKAGKSSTGSSSIRFCACSLWARYCQLYDCCLLLDVYSLAFHLLPTMAWLGLSITDRQHFLQEVGPVVEEAVSAVIAADQCKTAIEWMDQGHSIIWGQLLQLRTPVDDLRRCHPDIADRFTMLSKKLEGASAGDNFKAASNDLLHRPVSSTSESYHKLADERDKLVQHIRGLDGFDRFLLPRTFSQLQMAARNGPVISINVSKLHCDALILMPDLDDILHIPLEKFTHRGAEVLYRCLRLLLGRKGCNMSHGSRPRKAQNDIHISDSATEAAFEHICSKISTLHDEDRGTFVGASGDPETEFQNILAHLWHTVVKPILSGLAMSVCCFRI